MTESPDTHELDALESLEISEGYRIVIQRVRDMIETGRDYLENGVSNRYGLNGVEGTQGYLKACRTFLDLPAILRAEIKSQMKEPR